MNKLILILVILLASSGSLWAAGGSYTTANGLVGNDVKSFGFEKDGTKWFGTTEGLSKFDGCTWENYTASNGLAGNEVWDIAIDKAGNRWFATNGGVSRLSGSGFTNFTTTDGFTSNNIRSVAIDTLGNVWIGTWGGGIWVFNGLTWETQSINSLNVYTIQVSPDGTIWVGTDGGVNRFDGSTWTSLTESDGLVNNVVHEISFGTDGTVWFATDAGVSSYDGSAFTTHFTTYAAQSVTVDSANTVWISTANNGVYRSNGGIWDTLTNITSGLVYDGVHSSSTDWQGTVWFGTNGGISYTDNKSSSDISFLRKPVNYAARIGTSIGVLTHSALFTPDAGVTYSVISGSGNDLFSLSGDTLKTIRLISESEDSLRASIEASFNGSIDTLNISIPVTKNQTPTSIGLSSLFMFDTVLTGGHVAKINTIDPDLGDTHTYAVTAGTTQFGISGTRLVTAGRLTTGTYPVTIQATDRGGKTLEQSFTITVRSVDTTIHSNGTLNTFTGSNNIPGMFTDTDGNQWFSSLGGGITKRTGNEMVNYNAGSNINSEGKMDLNGIYWFPSEAGVVSFDGTNWKTYTTDSGLVGNDVNCLTIDNQGNKWFGTSGGISKFDGSTWTNYTTASTLGGLANQFIYGLTFDGEGNLWVGTQGGVSRFDGFAWKTWNTGSGLAGDYVYTIAVDTDGTKWFATNGGVSRFEGSAITKNFTTSEGLFVNDVHSVTIDNNGIIWCGTWGGGVSAYDGTNWTNYNSSTGLVYDNVHDVTVDDQNRKWAVTEGGVSYAPFQIATTIPTLSTEVEFDDTVGTMVGTVSSKLFNVADTTTTYTFLTGVDDFTIVKDTIRTKRLFTEDTLLAALVECSKLGTRDTISFEMPVRHWVKGANSTKVRVEIPDYQFDLNHPNGVDITYDIRLIPIGTYLNKTTTFVTSKGTLVYQNSYNDTIQLDVPATGTELYLAVHDSELVQGVNTITLTAYNGTTVIGTNEFSLTVSDFAAVSGDSTVLADSTGEVVDFSVSLNTLGKKYFAGEDVDVVGGKMFTLNLNCEKTYGSFDWAVVDTVSKSEIYSGRYDPAMGSKQIPLQFSGSTYEFIVKTMDGNTASYATCSLTDSATDTTIDLRAGAVYASNIVDSYGTNWSNYYNDRYFTPFQAYRSDLGTLTSPFTDSTVDLQVSAIGDTLISSVVFTGKTSGKQIVAPLCRTNLPYQFVTLSDSAPYIISNGVTDTVTKDIWAYGDRNNSLGYPSKLANGKWESFTRSSTSGKLVDDNVNTIAVAPDGKVWIGTPRGISIYTGTTWETPINQLSQLSDTNIAEIRFGSNGNVFVRSSNIWDSLDVSDNSWSKGIADLTTIPTVSSGREIWMSSGFNPVSEQYGFKGATVKQFTLVTPKTPTDILLTKPYFVDSLSAGTIVGVLSTVDSNSQELHTYSVVAGGDKFILSGDTLKTKVMLDTTTQITLKTTDERGLYFEKSLSIYKKVVVSKDLSKDVQWTFSTDSDAVYNGSESILKNDDGSVTISMGSPSGYFGLNGSLPKSMLFDSIALEFQAGAPYSITVDRETVRHSTPIISTSLSSDIQNQTIVVLDTIQNNTIPAFVMDPAGVDRIAFRYTGSGFADPNVAIRSVKATVLVDSSAITVKDTTINRTGTKTVAYAPDTTYIGVTGKEDTVITVDTVLYTYDSTFAITDTLVSGVLYLSDTTLSSVAEDSTVLTHSDTLKWKTEITVNITKDIDWTFNSVGNVSYAVDTTLSTDPLTGKTTVDFGSSFDYSYYGNGVNGSIPVGAYYKTVKVYAKMKDDNLYTDWDYCSYTDSGRASDTVTSVGADTTMQLITLSISDTTISNGDTVLVDPRKLNRIEIREGGAGYYWYNATIEIDSVTATILVDPTNTSTTSDTTYSVSTRSMTTVDSVLVNSSAVGQKDTLVISTHLDLIDSVGTINVDTLLDGFVTGTSTSTFTLPTDTTVTSRDTLKLIYLSGVKGDFNGDGILDILDFTFAAYLWDQSQKGLTIRPAYELAPYSGKFPNITVQPDSKFNYLDLGLFVDFCFYNDDLSGGLSPLPQTTIRSRSSGVVASTEVIGDSVKITFTGSAEGIRGAAFEIDAYNEPVWSKGSALERAGQVLTMTQAKAGISRFSQAMVTAGTGEGELATLTVAKSAFVDGKLTVRYALVDENQNVCGSGSLDAVIEKAIEETVTNGKQVNVYPNPSVSMDRGGEGFVFVVNNGNSGVKELSVKVFSSVGTLLFSADKSGFRETDMNIYTAHWDGNNLSAASALAVFRIVGEDGVPVLRKVMLGVAK